MAWTMVGNGRKCGWTREGGYAVGACKSMEARLNYCLLKAKHGYPASCTYKNLRVNYGNFDYCR